ACRYLVKAKTVPFFFFFSSRRRHTRFSRDWSSDVCSSDLGKDDFIFAITLLPEHFYFLIINGVNRHAYVIWLYRQFPIKSTVYRSEERRVGKECRCGWAR